MDVNLLIPFLFLAGCEDTVSDAGSIAYEGPSDIAPSLGDEELASLDIDGRYGASAADCAANNRYMTEFVDVGDGALTYRGQSTHIMTVREDEITLRGGERLAREGDRLVRWPEDRSKRTVYTRCS